MQNSNLKSMLTPEEIKTISRFALGKLSLKAQFETVLDMIVDQGLSRERAEELMISALASCKESDGKSTALDNAGRFKFIDMLGKPFNGDGEILKNMEFFLSSLLSSSDKLSDTVEQDTFRHIVANYDLEDLDESEQADLVSFKINLDKKKLSSIPKLV